MCRNIKPLYNFDPPASNEEIRDACLQFVRKITGIDSPSKTNRAAFINAVDALADITASLFSSLDTNAPPKDRLVEAEKARARSARRFPEDKPTPSIGPSKA